MSAQRNPTSRIVVFAILAISLIMYGHCIPGPVIGNIIMSTPEYDPNFIVLIQTFPNFGLIAASIAYGALSRKFSNRTLLIAGSICYLVGGVVPAFLGNNMPAIMAFRVILGLGTGIYCAIPPAMIAENFSMEHGGTVNGWVQVAASLGAMIFTTLSGIIGQADWHTVNYLALVVIPICIIGLICLPKENADSEAVVAAEKARMEAVAACKSMSFFEKYPPIVILYMVEIFFFIGWLMVFNMYASVVCASVGAGSVEAGFAQSMETAIGLVMGLIFGLVFKRTKEYTLVITSILMLVSYLMLANAGDIVTVYIASLILGIAPGWTCACIFQLAGKYAAPAAAGMAVSLCIAFQFAGGIVEGYVMPVLCGALGLDAANGFDSFAVGAFVYGVLAIVFLIQAVTGQKRRFAKAMGTGPIAATEIDQIAA